MKVLLNVPIEISSEDEVAKQVLAALPNKRILVYGADAQGDLAELVGPEKWRMVNCPTNPSHEIARQLWVTKSGTRHRVHEDDAEGVNLAEEAGLSYKSFASFGEFVRRTLNGDLATGFSAGTPAQWGTITVSLEFAAGSLATENDIGFNDTSLGTSMGSIVEIKDLIEGLVGVGSVSVNDPYEGEGYVDFVATLDGDLASISETGNSLGTWNRTGYVPAVVGGLANAILLDQIDDNLAFVVIASKPGDEELLAEVERDSATETSLFE